MTPPTTPLLRNLTTDALYKNEALDLIGWSGLFHLAQNASFSSGIGPDFKNPLVNVDSNSHLLAKNDSAGRYFAFVPFKVVQACVAASSNQAPKPALKVTVLFDPFSSNVRMFDFGLRSIFASRTDELRVLVCVPGNEGSEDSPKGWGIGITNTQIQKLLENANAGYSDPKVTVLAAWSNGWKGMVATMRASGQVNDLVDLGHLETVVFYDCLYFTNTSKGLVDDALTKVQTEIAKQSDQALQVVAYLVTAPGGNDSLDPQTILGGIPFLKKNALGQGLITFTNTRATLRKICIIRALAWALEEGAVSHAQVPQVIRSACAVINRTPRNTVRSLSALPYGKGAPPGSVDLATFARDPANAPLLNLKVGSNEFNQAFNLVSQGSMIYGAPDIPESEVDHIVLMPELAWEFLAG